MTLIHHAKEQDKSPRSQLQTLSYSLRPNIRSYGGNEDGFRCVTEIILACSFETETVFNRLITLYPKKKKKCSHNIWVQRTPPASQQVTQEVSNPRDLVGCQSMWTGSWTTVALCTLTGRQSGKMWRSWERIQLGSKRAPTVEKKWQPNVLIPPLQRTNLFFTSLNYKNINMAGGADGHGQRFHISLLEL